MSIIKLNEASLCLSLKFMLDLVQSALDSHSLALRSLAVDFSKQQMNEFAMC